MYILFYRLICPFITPSIHDRMTSNYQLWFLTKMDRYYVIIIFNWYYVIIIFKLVYLRYLLPDRGQTCLSISIMIYFTSGLPNMTSLCFQLRISLLLYVGLSHTLIREISIVHITLRSYKKTM